MSIPYNANLSWQNYTLDPDWHKNPSVATASSMDKQNERMYFLTEVFKQGVQQPVVRSVQFVRDAARLVLKVPLRSCLTPVWLEKNWKERERAKINVLLTGYSFVQLLSVPVKFFVALAALLTSGASWKKAEMLLKKSNSWTAHVDGRASQLEAIKEEGRPNAESKEEFLKYKQWLYTINPELCMKAN